MRGYISLWATAIITFLIIGTLIFCFYMRCQETENRVSSQVESVDQLYKMMRDNPTAAGRGK